MRLPEQFTSFINFNIALFCLLVGIFFMTINLSPTLYDLFFIYLKTFAISFGIVFFTLGSLLFIGLRFQEGKKVICMRTTNIGYDVDKKILQQKTLLYFQSKNIKHLTPDVKINKDEIIEINIQSNIELNKHEFDQYEIDLKKIFAEVGYKKPIYFNYIQSI